MSTGKLKLDWQLQGMSTEDVPPGLFSSPQIMLYLNHNQLITDYIEKGIRSTTYDMRFGSPFFVFKNNEGRIQHLGNTINQNREIVKSITIEPNQLVFVTTIESFKLPPDVVARFNLKSKWVHRGLLLGTGPIVDPEFTGKLLIPIHNFSNTPVMLEYGDPLIAVEFTKTLLNTMPKGDYIPNPKKDGNPVV